MYYKKQIGPLDCVLHGPEIGKTAPELIVLLCHGFGAPGTDLVPLADEILADSQIDKEKILFVFPAAPMTLDSFGGFEGRAWWLINMQALADMAGTNDFTQLRQSVPPGIIDAREMLNETIAEIFELTSTDYSQLIIGGFSQGAMLTAETVLTSSENPACLIQMSGTMICEQQWKEKIKSHAGLKVLQSHGKIDPVLPYEAAEWLKELFEQNECQVDFLPFMGPHTIPMPVLVKIRELIEGLLAR